MGVVSGLMGAYGAMQSASYNSKVSLQNAAFSDAAAADAIARGTQAVARENEKGAQAIGTQQADYAASGVTSAGSPSAVMTDTSFYKNIGVMTAMNNASREAWGYQVKGNQFRDQASMERQQGEFQAAGDILGGVASTASMFATTTGK